MEGVNHVHVVEVGGGGLVGQVYRVVQGQVPDGERLKLGVAGLYPPLVLVVQLGEAGGHFAAARARGGDHHQAAGGLHILVFAEALVADDKGDVGGVAWDGVVPEHLYPQGLQTLLEGLRRGLGVVLGQHHAAHIQANAPEGVDQPQHVHVVGDAQVPADLVLLDVPRADDDDDFRLVLHLQQHLHLAVGQKAGQNPGGVVVVEKLASKLHVKLAPKQLDPLPNLLRLGAEILLVVKTDVPHSTCSPVPFKLYCARKRGRLAAPPVFSAFYYTRFPPIPQGGAQEKPRCRAAGKKTH